MQTCIGSLVGLLVLSVVLSATYFFREFGQQRFNFYKKELNAWYFTPGLTIFEMFVGVLLSAIVGHFSVRVQLVWLIVFMGLFAVVFAARALGHASQALTFMWSAFPLVVLHSLVCSVAGVLVEDCASLWHKALFLTVARVAVRMAQIGGGWMGEAMERHDCALGNEFVYATFVLLSVVLGTSLFLTRSHIVAAARAHTIHPAAHVTTSASTGYPVLEVLRHFVIDNSLFRCVFITGVALALSSHHFSFFPGTPRAETKSGHESRLEILWNAAGILAGGLLAALQDRRIPAAGRWTFMRVTAFRARACSTACLGAFSLSVVFYMSCAGIRGLEDEQSSMTCALRYVSAVLIGTGLVPSLLATICCVPRALRPAAFCLVSSFKYGFADLASLPWWQFWNQLTTAEVPSRFLSASPLLVAVGFWVIAVQTSRRWYREVVASEHALREAGHLPALCSSPPSPGSDPLAWEVKRSASAEELLHCGNYRSSVKRVASSLSLATAADTTAATGSPDATPPQPLSAIVGRWGFEEPMFFSDFPPMRRHSA